MSFRVSRPVQIQDKGASRVLRAAAAASFQIKIGVFGSEKHEGSELTVAQLLEIHELGLGVPERSVLRAWAEQNEASIQRDFGAALGKILTGKMTPDTAAKILGVRWVGQIQQFISDGKVTPPLAASTIAAKGSSTPLLDSGQLKSAITYIVTKLFA